MKTCIKCHETFPLTDEYYNRRKDSPDGFRNECKMCVKKRRGKWHERNREDQVSKMKRYWIENREDMLCYKAQYNQKNKELINKKCHDYYEKNRPKVLAQMKEHRIANKDQINQRRRTRRIENYESVTEKRREYAAKNRGRINKRAAMYCANRKETDMGYRILTNLRTRICIAIKKSHSNKSNGTTKLLGCTIPELRKHLENQFAPGMSWDNWARGGWHIDHIIPCASFDLSDPKQQRKCFNYKNLQPLWALDNLKKGARLV